MSLMMHYGHVIAMMHVMYSCQDTQENGGTKHPNYNSHKWTQIIAELTQNEIFLFGSTQ